MTTKSTVNDDALDEQVTPASKRRTRIVKKDTDHVYSASQEQGERFDSIDEERTHKRAARAIANEEKAAAIHALESEVLVPPKKNRGRPSKAYLEAQRAYEEALARQQSKIEEARAALSGTSPEIAVASTAEMYVSADKEDSEAKAVTAEALPQTENKVAEPIPTVVEEDDDDDLPDFVKMQKAAAEAAAKAAVESAVPEEVENVGQKENTAENTEPDFRESEFDGAAESPSVCESVKKETVLDAVPKDAQNADSTCSVSVLSQLSAAFADGRRFIIIEDVPIVDAEGYTFTLPPEPEETLEPVRFRRFHEDPMVQNTNDVIAMARNLVNSSTPAETTAKELSGQDSEILDKPAPVRLGEVTVEAQGVVDIDNQGVGYLRSADYNYMPSPDDVFVAQNQIRSYSLKTGDLVSCIVRAPREGEKYYALKEIISINGLAPHLVRDRIAFEHLTPLFPDEQFHLSKRGERSPLTCRIVDLFAPIGKGQRSLIVAQPKTGKTILMKQIANAIAANHPDTYLIMLLIDERPEEVTDMARTVNAEVIASTFDEPAKRHVRIANIVLEKAKRLVECGRDVVIFLDSITRLARAFNTEAPTSGKILTGGVDANALQKPKRFFGAARNIEGGGSLTIIATALIDTGSKMDEVIFEEFKGTGNMELVLDRGLANKRIFPAVNLMQSSTRREDLLLDETTVNRMFITRNFMSDMNPVEAMNFLRKHLESTISNEEFIASMGTTK